MQHAPAALPSSSQDNPSRPPCSGVNPLPHSESELPDSQRGRPNFHGPLPPRAHPCPLYTAAEGAMTSSAVRLRGGQPRRPHTTAPARDKHTPRPRTRKRRGLREATTTATHTYKYTYTHTLPRHTLIKKLSHTRTHTHTRVCLW
jgi:hypothetical protein